MRLAAMRHLPLIALALIVVSSPLPAAESKTNASTPAVKNATAEGTHWVNKKSHIRHNKSCRYYGKGKNGQACGPTEGKACKVCGG